jgi:hypothetical protein
MIIDGVTAMQPTGKTPAAHGRPGNFKAHVRALVALALIVVWGLAAASGFLLWFAPYGPRSGWQVLFLGLTKHQWKGVHFWLALYQHLCHKPQSSRATVLSAHPDKVVLRWLHPIAELHPAISLISKTFIATPAPLCHLLLHRGGTPFIALMSLYPLDL